MEIPCQCGDEHINGHCISCLCDTCTAPTPETPDWDLERMDRERVTRERDEARSELARIKGMHYAAVRVFLRLESGGEKVLTPTERNRVVGLPDDWKRLSERYTAEATDEPTEADPAVKP